MIALKRVYEPAASDDGSRILVERLWPRGLSKERAHIDQWLKELAPSDALRRWYGHDPAHWSEFRTRYLEELATPEAQAALRALAEQARHGKITLVFAARSPELSNAAILAELLSAMS